MGPILGGILIAVIGAANVLFIDAASFAASAIFVAIGVPAAANRAQPAQPQGSLFGTVALTPPLGILVVAGFAGGLLFGPINPIASTVIQEHTPPQMLGRVFGALTALAQAGIPIGAVLAGVVVQRAGLIPTIIGMGVLYLLVPLGMYFNRALHQMDTSRRGSGSSPAAAVE